VKGTWTTTDSGVGGRGVLIALAVVVLFGSGAAAELATAVLAALIAVAVVLVLIIAGGITWLICRARRERPAVTYRAEVSNPPVKNAPLGGEILTGRLDSTPPALEPPAPRELHQHWHQHFYNVDAEQVAEILRRHERPE
jgi:hypothetical protein